MIDKNELTRVPIQIYALSDEPFSSTLTKARCAIFYKGANRNGTFITDEFAKHLLSTLPYTPIKGIYNDEEGDFGDHGKERSEGRIFAITPENPNVSWEDIADDSGVTHTYACCDVLLFSGIYPNITKNIIGKSLSMEIYLPTITGEWTLIDGDMYFKYLTGDFLGLQVLGDDVEPCFEGAQFYQNIGEFFSLINTYAQALNIKGGHKMPNKDNFIKALNESANGTYTLLSLEDTSAFCYNKDSNKFAQITFTCKDDAYTIDKVDSYSMDGEDDPNKEQYAKLKEQCEALQKDNEGCHAELETSKKECSKLQEEKDGLCAANESLQKEKCALEAELESLKKANCSLEEYKTSVETNQKETLISKYSAVLSEDELKPFNEKLADYSLVDLEKDLSFAYTQSKGDALFTLDSNKSNNMIPKPASKGGIEAILDKYSK